MLFNVSTMTLRRQDRWLILALAHAASLLFSGRLWADSEGCAVCGRPLTNDVYLVTDKVTDEQKKVCGDCLLLPRCFLCGLPAKDDSTQLPDGRVLCARDARTAVLNEDDALRICGEQQDALGRLLSRFVSFPETNLTVALVDRVALQELFKFPGNDYTCPNVWGYMETRTNYGHLQHAIRLLNGLPQAGFKATCAHELGHVWLNENLPAERKQRINHDAIEGFCELLAFMLMDSENEQAQIRQIKLNAYTRGQIALFIEAEQRYGFNDIADWMKCGTDDRLHGEDLARVRLVETPPKAAIPQPTLPVFKGEPLLAPEVLVLKGVLWSPIRPLVLINDRTFELKEEGTVRLGKTNVTLRCLEIHQDSVRIRIVGSGQEQELRVKDAGR